MGTDLEDLKKRRSVAQAAFTKAANNIDHRVNYADDAELVRELKDLRAGFKRLMDITEDLVAALSEGEDSSATAVDDLYKKRDTCSRRLVDTEDRVKSALWTRFVEGATATLEEEFQGSFEETKKLCSRKASSGQRGREEDILRGQLHAYEGLVREWSGFVQRDKADKMSKRVRELKGKINRLMADWANVESEEEEPEEEEEGSELEVNSDQESPDKSNTVQIKTAEETSDRTGNSDSATQVTIPLQLSSEPTASDKPPPAVLSPVSRQPERVLSFSPLPNSASTPRPSDSRTAAPRDYVASHDGDARHSGSGVSAGGSSSYLGARPKIKLAALELPKFTGDRRFYCHWRKNWECLQALAEPTGSEECKRFHLLDSVEAKVRKELRLDHCRSTTEIFRLLENRYGNKEVTARLIVKELEDIPAIKGNQPRQTIELVRAVERALCDLQDLDMVDVIKNRMTVNSIEQKLPMTIREKWLFYERDPINAVTPGTYFDRLLLFLKEHEEVLERLAGLELGTHSYEKPSHREKPSDKRQGKQSNTRAAVSEVKESPQEPCPMCGEEGHGKRLFRCKAFRKAALSEKRALVKKVKACHKCLGSHGVDGACNLKFLCRKEECAPADHHYFLCSRPVEKKEPKAERKKGSRGPTEEQEIIFAGLNLSPEQLSAVRQACTNVTSRACSGRGFVEEGDLKEHPVLMMLVDITTKRGDHLGTLIDLASDTNYITHQAAERLGLIGEPITLVVYGVGEMAVKVDTKKYVVTIKVWKDQKTLRLHKMICYGLESIAKVDRVVDSERLEQFFTDVEPGALARPEEIELLISTREGRLAPERLQRVGDLVLWDGPLGKTVSGTHPDLFEEVEVTARHSLTTFARSMRTVAVKVEERLTRDLGKRGHQVKTTAASNKEILEWMRWDSIGAACEPLCGNCRCGRCPPGGKEMSLSDERELAIVKAGLTFREKDAHSEESHWDAKYPWKEDPATLPNNRKAVEATFLRTEKRLEREPAWKEAYSKQIHEMVDRGAAVKLTKSRMEEWTGSAWWVSHLTAPNPHSVTTPVRIVWDSSQEYKGVSLNSILLKGPDVLNPIRAVLLRFREGEFAAIGDVRKMYNSVWLEEQEVHVHRFLWRDSPEDELEDYAVVRVNMGDRPAGCIAQVAMRETARLPQFSHLVDERRVIEENCYVDDVFASGNDSHRLEEILEGVEAILKTGGFHLKPWVRSGHSGRPTAAEAKPMTLVLPNQLKEEDNKALGVGYLVQDDKLFIMVSINFSRRKKKMRTEVDLMEEEIAEKTPNPLTRRVLLSQVAGLYDPLGLATPLKQKGVILVRRAF